MAGMIPKMKNTRREKEITDHQTCLLEKSNNFTLLD